MLVFDDKLTGFGLRITAGGAKLFLFQYRRGKAVHRIAIGKYGPVTVAEARKLAKQYGGQVAEGRSPAGERASAVAAEAAASAASRKVATEDAFTLSVLIDRWEQTGLKYASAAHRKEGPAAMRRGLSAFLKQPARAVTPAEAQHRIDAIAEKTPAMARRTRDYARRAYNWAISRRLLTANPFGQIAIEARQIARDRVLSDAELGAAWRAASATDYPFGPVMQLLILTLQRRAEVAGMRWPELAADLSTWTIPAVRSKNRKGHVVHLSEPARAVLLTVPRIIGRDLLFTTTGTRPVSGFTHAAQALRRNARSSSTTSSAGAPTNAGGRKAVAEPAAAEWRLHDFRRTGVTTLARLGVLPHVADRILNHVSGVMRGVMAVYQRHDFIAERQAALDLWAAHVLATAAQVDAPTNVVQMNPAAKKLRNRRRQSANERPRSSLNPTICLPYPVPALPEPAPPPRR